LGPLLPRALAAGASLHLSRFSLPGLRPQADPADVAQRIEAADAETLLRWSERVLTAKTLDEILAD
jgi:hypothetical protein